MYSLGNNLYDGTKDRRYGMLFFVTLITLFGLCILGVVITETVGADNLQEYFVFALLGLSILISAVTRRWIRRKRNARRERFKFVALSRNELANARSKLMKGRLKS